LLHLLGSFEQTVFPLSQLCDLGLDGVSLSSGVCRELHDDEQADHGYKKDDYREGPRNNAITKWF
jgi:hypothetical protein